MELFTCSEEMFDSWDGGDRCILVAFFLLYLLSLLRLL